MTRTLTALLLGALFLAGCGDSEPETEQAARAPDAVDGGWEANPFLADIDSDSAYVYANLERLPEAVNAKAWATNEVSAAGNRAMFEALADDEEVPEQARVLIGELTGLSTREGWEAAGLHPNPYYAFYGVELMPFLRFELSDGAAFAEFVGRIESDLATPFTRREVEGSEVIWIEIRDGLGVAVHHGESAATAAMIPDDAAFLARVAGAYEPAAALPAGELSAFNASQGFTAHGSGYIDWRRFIDTMLAEDAPLASLSTDSQLADLAADPACVAEYGALGEAMPRLSFGYTGMSESAVDFVARQELSDELAAGLRPVARAPVAIDRELDGLFNFGLAFDLVAAREFARSLVDGWVADPPQCASFKVIADNAAEMQENLARPIPPIVTNIHGLYLEAMSLDLGENGIPTGGGTLTMFMKNPQLLTGMAQMFSPAVAELGLEPDGEPKQVPPEALPQLGQFGLEAWIAMADSAIGIAVGEEHIDALTRSIQPSGADDLVLTGSLNFRMLTDLMDLAEAVAEDLDEDAARGLEAQRAQYEALAEIYDRAAFKIGFGDGIEFVGETRLR